MGRTELYELTVEREARDIYTDSLSLNYDIDVSLLARSNVWDGENDRLLLCQVVSLEELCVVVCAPLSFIHALHFRRLSLARNVKGPSGVAQLALRRGIGP